MKLLSIDVKSFGNLKNFKFDFEDGLNIFCERNGFGKTTIASYIKAMFYGINYTTKRDLTQNEYKKFKPFNSTAKFGGSLRFNHEGKNYRIERFFGNTLREQELRFFDDDTNKPYKAEFGDPNTELGMRLFNIDAQAFLRCVYCPQSDVVIASNDSFVKRLSNLAQDTDEENNFQKAEDRLREFCKQLKYEKGTGGKIYELSRQREALMRKNEEAKSAIKKIDSLSDAVLKSTDRLTEIISQTVSLNQKLEACDKKIERFEGLQQQNQIKKTIQQHTEEESSLLTELSQTEQQLSKTQSLAGQADEELKKLLTQQSVLPSTVDTSKKTAMPMWQNILCILLCLTGVGLCFAKWYFGVPVILLSLVLFVVFLSKQRAIQKINFDTMQKQNDLIATAAQNAQQKREQVLAESARFKEETAQLQNTKLQLSARLLSVKHFKDVAMQQLSELNPVCDELLPTETLTQAQKEREHICVQLQDLSVRQRTEELNLSADRRELVTLTQNPLNPIEIEEQIEDIGQQINDCQYKYQAAQQARDILKNAKESLTNAYLPRLNKSFNSYLSILTDDADMDAKVDADFNVTVLSDGAYREVAYLSEGYQQIFNFALRLALMNCLYNDTLPLLILDDPFVNCDSQNLASAMRLLQKLSLNTQILYLTCHK